MNPSMRVDMGHGGVSAGHSRYPRTQYMDSAYGQAPPVATAHAPMNVHMGGYEWNGYGAPGMAHNSGSRTGGNSRGTAQSLRSKIAERLQQIDREAFETKEQRYQKKAEEIQNEIVLILRGKHPTFENGVKRLKINHDRMVASAEQHHRYLVSMYERAFKHEREQAEQAYKNEKQAVFDKIAADIEERRKRLKEEKDSLDINADFVLDSGVRTSSKRNLRKRGMDSLSMSDGPSANSGGRVQSKRKANQTLSMQGLPEDDIISDLMAIRRATGVTGSLNSGANGKKGHKGHKR
ncbi:hypothetical protein H4R22_002842 [Coemansia sp. RSA 1290]|nr:hypothetical protein LPJ68_003585 [Coemansia sp. RSA 1086]KAJ1750107.1 hypothetical protein LPJ79_003206 [Coemansia sp. RSA 1821]KAJ1874331.1 hypothetical protein LPJ55_001578 [Coemansia sp. RSA 990]KAJ2630185.1 hypothetical protein H4R22_002842 [Coemansia sp. RSA 1290]KAJ2649477.1 hypothetical protein IWW40_003149 [Coemansia sp. RSA 1250]KAJ2670758.1 hypothetical protein IWW42_003791 [Coemansia sp. RSA 1085]